MLYRNLPKTDLNVSRLCLGAMYFGWREPEEQSIRRLDAFTFAGGNFIDTANIYAEHHLGDKDYFGRDFASYRDGGSERLIGAWMANKRNRSQLFIATKMGFPYPGVPYGTSPKAIREECEKSLRRLKTDYVDLYYLHTDDKNAEREEVLYQLSLLIKEGKIRYIGASNFTSERFEEVNAIAEREGLPSFVCIQQRHSYLRPKPEANFGGQVASDRALIDYVEREGLTLLAYSPLLSGYYNNRQKRLSANYQWEDTDRRLATLDAVSREIGKTPVQVVLAWMLAHNVLPLTAASNDKQLDELLEAESLVLCDEHLARLDRAGVAD